ncbi:type II secretion system protein [Verrucomicrobium sp. GAS474]|uniref:PulJ/GspJ family protein n=1 Tax=Verrucomicrobium sp. GAS474 TaxID=1882831 RepID=UPI0012FF7E83|nr:type II secretion system protein [Verrucomicrobium sp. GAS474]
METLSHPIERARRPAPRGNKRGFTLVEIMVSIGVLLCIILLVAQLVSSLSATTSNASKRSDSDNQARLIFSKMAADFAAISSRADVNYAFLSQNGNDSFYFYSEASGHISSGDPAGTGESTLSGVSLIGYRVSDGISGGARVELERLGLGLHWVDVSSQTGTSGQGRSVLFLPTLIRDAFSKTLANPNNNSSNPNTSNPSPWDVIGDQVFRMEFCFLLKDGTFAVTPVIRNSGAKGNFAAAVAPQATDDASAGYAPGSRWYNAQSQVAYRCVRASTKAAFWTPLGLQDVKAVVVSLALLHPKARATIQVGALTRSIPLLPDFAGSPVIGSWTTAAGNASVFKAGGMNPMTASSVRVYQRFFYLN